MKTMKYLFIITMLTFAGCADDGDPGPKGDQGEQGTQGEPGPQGPAGTANVIYSDWMDFDWNVIDEITSKQMIIDEPAITEEFIENGGSVLVFLKGSSPTGIRLLVQFPYSSGNDFLYAAAVIVPPGTVPSVTVEHGIMIDLSSQDNTTPVNDYQDEPDVNYDWRYILIPGGVTIAEHSSRSSSVDWTAYDYKEIKRLFNIPD